MAEKSPLESLQEKLDKDFADTIIQWRGGQGAQSSANLQRIKPVIKALRSGEPLTGLLKGLVKGSSKGF